MPHKHLTSHFTSTLLSIYKHHFLFIFFINFILYHPLLTSHSTPSLICINKPHSTSTSSSSSSSFLTSSVISIYKGHHFIIFTIIFIPHNHLVTSHFPRSHLQLNTLTSPLLPFPRPVTRTTSHRTLNPLVTPCLVLTTPALPLYVASLTVHSLSHREVCCHSLVLLFLSLSAGVSGGLYRWL